MTPQQKQWLDEHPDYHVLGQAGGNVRWTWRGTLHPDGTYEKAAREKPAGYAKDSFGVGKKEVVEPGKMPDPRNDFGTTKVSR